MMNSWLLSATAVNKRKEIVRSSLYLFSALSEGGGGKTTPRK
jgi:hypothetical protein